MLYERYNPKTWADYVGHVATVARVRKIIEARDYTGGGFLLTGDSGGGKSSMAGVMANVIAREPVQRVLLNGDDCTVEAVRELRETLANPSMFGPWCVVINECHGLSPQAIKSWLTFFDKRPRGATIIFTTTERAVFREFDAPMFSRVLKFHLAADPANLEAFAAYVKGVAVLEGLALGAPFDSFRQLITRCNYNLREALTQLEQGALEGPSAQGVSLAA